MNWELGGVRIFTQDLKDEDDNIIARLNPLGGGTILHFFGYDDQITKVSAYIVGLTDKAALKAMAEDTSSYTLNTPYGTWGDFYVKHVTFALQNIICQTLRPDLDEDAPVFKVDIDLYIEV